MGEFDLTNPKCVMCGSKMREIPESYEYSITLFECGCGCIMDEYGNVKERGNNDKQAMPRPL